MRNYVRAAYVDTGAPQRAVGSAELQDRAEEG
jgi:hypothetical protein